MGGSVTELRAAVNLKHCHDPLAVTTTTAKHFIGFWCRAAVQFLRTHCLTALMSPSRGRRYSRISRPRLIGFSSVKTARRRDDIAGGRVARTCHRTTSCRCSLSGRLVAQRLTQTKQTLPFFLFNIKSVHQSIICLIRR